MDEMDTIYRALDLLLFASGMALGRSQSDDDEHARVARQLAWYATEIALQFNRPTLNWRYDRG